MEWGFSGDFPFHFHVALLPIALWQDSLAAICDNRFLESYRVAMAVVRSRSEWICRTVGGDLERLASYTATGCITTQVLPGDNYRTGCSGVHRLTWKCCLPLI